MAKIKLEKQVNSKKNGLVFGKKNQLSNFKKNMALLKLFDILEKYMSETF